MDVNTNYRREMEEDTIESRAAKCVGRSMDACPEDALTVEALARSCALPWRDAGAHERYGRFKHTPIADDSKVTIRPGKDGRIIRFRGTGFYSGARRNFQ